ncbi:LysR family transcriptional regulator [Caballeronia sp. S22]|uniref:LysR family transcriptional regulator n=1 Tax=Caballeronia sp. S22 TaxID=3137182 RepID=UPI00353102ED
MDSRLLEYFLRVTELGSINKAAADLGLSQPALSRHIAALEHEMGATLLVRTQGGVTLTDSGKLLSDRSRSLLRQYAILKEQVGERAAGQLSVGIPPSWQRIFTSRFVEKITASYPGVSLRVYEGVSNTLRDYMYAGLLDLCIAPFDNNTAAGYRQTPLLREPLVLVGGETEQLEPDEPVSISRLAGTKLVLPGRPNFLRLQIENTLIRKGQDFRLAVETDTLTLCLDLARKGMGFTVVPACALTGLDFGAAVRWAPIRGMYMTWAVCENQSRTHSQALREGRRLVFSLVAETLEARTWFGAEPAGGALSRLSAARP